MTQDIGARVRTIIAAVVTPAVEDAARLIEDLGADSLTFEEIGLALEQEFAIGRITPEEQSSWVTVGDVVKTVEGKLA
jgi:acyl carrier protein